MPRSEFGGFGRPSEMTVAAGGQPILLPAPAIVGVRATAEIFKSLNEFSPDSQPSPFSITREIRSNCARLSHFCDFSEKYLTSDPSVIYCPLFSKRHNMTYHRCLAKHRRIPAEE